MTVLNNLVLNRCYEADDFGPNNQYCALIDPRLPASDPQRGNLASFLNPYLNVSEQTVKGIDFDMRYSTPLFGGKLVFEGQATRMIDQTFQLFATDEAVDYNGTLGVQAPVRVRSGVASGELRYTFPSDKVTVHWSTICRSQEGAIWSIRIVAGAVLGRSSPDLYAEAYWEHGVSVSIVGRRCQ